RIDFTCIDSNYGTVHNQVWTEGGEVRVNGSRIRHIQFVMMQRHNLVSGERFRKSFAHQAACSDNHNLHRDDCASLARSISFTSGHSSSTMLKNTESRTRPPGSIKCLRKMPSCFAPRRRIAARDRSLRISVMNSTRTHFQVSNACVSSKNFASLLMGER